MNINNVLECSTAPEQAKIQFVTYPKTLVIDDILNLLLLQLQHLVTDDVCSRVTDMYLSESANKATGGTLSTQTSRATAEAAYQRKAEQLMSDENCFKVRRALKIMILYMSFNYFSGLLAISSNCLCFV